MKLPRPGVASIVAVGLALLAIGSALTYSRLKPKPVATQLVYGSGRIEADEFRLASEVGGRVLEITAVEGRTVGDGAMLARLDASDLILQAERAAAQVGAATQTAAQIDAQIDLASHHARTAKADLDRYETLARQGWIPSQQLDRARNAYTAASEQVRVLGRQRAEAEAQRLVAAKSLELARYQIAKTKIHSPRAGAVLDRLAEPGEVVAPGQPLAVLADLSTVDLKVFVSERDLGKIRLGAPTRIRIDAFPGRDFPARVAQIDVQAQFTPRDVHMEEERTRTVYGVTLQAANPEGVLKPGMPADAWILWDARAEWPARLQVPE